MTKTARFMAVTALAMVAAFTLACQNGVSGPVALGGGPDPGAHAHRLGRGRGRERLLLPGHRRGQEHEQRLDSHPADVPRQEPGGERSARRSSWSGTCRRTPFGAFTATGLQAACKDLTLEPNRRRQAGPRAGPVGVPEVGEPASGLPALCIPRGWRPWPSTGALTDGRARHHGRPDLGLDAPSGEPPPPQSVLDADGAAEMCLDAIQQERLRIAPGVSQVNRERRGPRHQPQPDVVVEEAHLVAGVLDSPGRDGSPCRGVRLRP